MAAGQHRSYADREPLFRARLELENDIAVYSRAIVDVKTRLNRLTLIGRLPSELLSEILVNAVMDASDWRSLSWIKHSHVCSLFRNAALGDPRFWRFLNPSSSKALRFLILRSRNVPLHITGQINNKDRADRTLVLDMISQQSHRLREIRIEGPYDLLRKFYAKSVSRMGIVRKLALFSNDLHGPRVGMLSAAPVCEAVNAEAPPLRHLELHKIPFRWSDRVFSSRCITTLKLTARDAHENAPDLPDTGAPHELLTALKTFASSLEVLDLDGVFPSEPLTSPESPLLPPHMFYVPLPRLRTMRLVGDSFYIAHVLNHFLIPETVPLTFVVRNPAGIEEFMRALSVHLSKSEPRACAAISDHICSIWGSRQDPRVQPVLKIFFEDRDLARMLRRIVENGRDTFAGVEHLTLGPPPGFEEWTDLFLSFPNVRTLRVGHNSDRFLQDLMAPTSTLLDDRRSVLLPLLSVLELSDNRLTIPELDPDPFEELLDWTIFRCNYGCPIDRIVLQWCNYDVDVDILGRLREVVLDVEWGKRGLRFYEMRLAASGRVVTS
ncbi:hypothetical protein C8Q77DRAFT_1160381 [Trametes polyzona]|nr:hypothetical protein C8Q77DRAFT_1160381 [Trametes polyzona]